MKSRGKNNRSKIDRSLPLALPPSVKQLPIQTVKRRYIMNSSANGCIVNGACMLALVGAVSAGAGTSTSAFAIQSAIRLRRVAVYAPLIASGYSAARLQVAGGDRGPAQIMLAQSTAAAQVPAVYIPKEGDAAGFWINWVGPVDETLFEVFTEGGTTSQGCIIDVTYDYVLCAPAGEFTAFWTLAGALATGLQYMPLDSFISGSAGANTTRPELLGNAVTSTTYTLVV